MKWLYFYDCIVFERDVVGMANILDYLDWRGDLTLEQSPFNEVDNLILSQLSYANFDGVVPPEWSDAKISVREAAERYFHIYSRERIESYGYMLRSSVFLLQRLADSIRFADAKLMKFQNMVEFGETKQFSAMHIKLTDGTVYVAFRGTDTTLVGWKENFNMTFLTTVPSQLEAVRYLDDTTNNSRYPLRLGGHSKGGNLAMYAAIMCRAALKPRIIEVYNNDGPGFDAEIIKSSAYNEMRHVISTIVPQSSVVGMLLEHEETAYAVVKSNQSLLMQHDPFSWEVLGDRFVRVEQVTKESRIVELALKAWLNQLSPSERKQFVDNIFQIFEEMNVNTIDELSRDKWKKVSQMIRALNQSYEHKVVLTRTLKILFREGRKALLDSRKLGRSED